MPRPVRYSTIAMIVLFGPLLDILSTEMILHHGRVGGGEANAIVAGLHEGGGVWLFRAVTLGLTGLALFGCRLSPGELRLVLASSFTAFLFGKARFPSSNLKLRLNLLFAVSLFSTSRLLAGLSNISGEFLDLSLPILFDRIVGLRSGAHVYMASVLTSLTLSLVLIGALWSYARAEQRQPQR